MWRINAKHLPEGRAEHQNQEETEESFLKYSAIIRQKLHLSYTEYWNLTPRETEFEMDGYIEVQKEQFETLRFFDNHLAVITCMLYNANSRNPLKVSDFKLLPSEENDVQTQLSSDNKNLHLQLMAQSKERVSKRL